MLAEGWKVPYPLKGKARLMLRIWAAVKVEMKRVYIIVFIRHRHPCKCTVCNTFKNCTYYGQAKHKI